MEPERKTAPALLAIQRELVSREPIFHHPELAADRFALEAMRSMRHSGKWVPPVAVTAGILSSRRY